MSDIEYKNSLLVQLLETNSPSGYEKDAVEVLQKSMANYCRIETDVIGNLYMTAMENAGLKIMLSAHCDEIGFQVVGVNNMGYIYIRDIGGVDRQILLGSEVSIITKKGVIDGVVGKKSIHILTEKDVNQNTETKNVWIDIGTSSIAETNEYVSIGDYVTLKSNFRITGNGKRVVSKGLDDKVGVYIISEVIKRLKGMVLPLYVVGVATTQEEIGCRGSGVAAYRVDPDIAITVDVGVATDIPNMGDASCGNFLLGKGPGICLNADNNQILCDLIRAVASENGIEYQNSIGFRYVGGNESTKIQVNKDGVATAHISIPNRYMHTAVEMCDIQDIENTITLIYNTICFLAESGYKRESFNLFL